jgi:hypothetical protein
MMRPACWFGKKERSELAQWDILTRKVENPNVIVVVVFSVVPPATPKFNGDTSGL